MRLRCRLVTAVTAIVLLIALCVHPAWPNVPTLVRDINTTPIGVSSDPAFLGALGGSTYLAATAGTHGVELWKTDGTNAGTVMVKDIEAGAGSSNPTNFVAVGSVAYFAATTQASGTKLWVTDGTSTGTRKVTDMAAGIIGFTPAVVGVLGARILITGADGSTAYTGLYLWGSDGTAAGTVQLAGINFGPGVKPNGLAVASNGKAYFAGFDQVQGFEPWVTDGTAAGTHVLASLGSGLFVSSFVQVGNYVYFTASVNALINLFRIRLTDDVIEQVTSSIDIEDYSTGDLPLTPFGTLVLFVGKSAGVEQVWRSDGTAAGTYAVANFNSTVGNSYLPPRFTVIGNHVLFATNTVSSGINEGVLSTDGTVAGTVNLSAVSFPNPALPETVLGTAGPYAYFGTAGYGAIYRTDGTPSGTQVVSTPPSLVGVLSFAGDASTVYFQWVGVNPTSGVTEYWTARYDPTANTTTVLQRSAVPSGTSPQPAKLFAWSAGRLFFGSFDPTKGLEPWVSDGTLAGTQFLADIAPEYTAAGSNPDSFYGFQGKLYFSANDGVSGQELWRSDGTSAGTQLAADIIPGALGSSPSNLFTAGNSLMFFAYDSVASARYLWRYDPVAATAAEFPSVGPPYTCGIFSPAVVQGVTYFPAFGDGVEPWRSDGTAAGTTELLDVAQGPGSSNPCQMAAFAGKVYFIAQQYGAQAGYGVWGSDGSTVGTRLVASLGPSPSATPFFLTAYAGALYFAGLDSSNTPTLWRSDGTSSGTTAVAALPVTLGTFIGVVNNRLLFAGTSLWIFDAGSSGFSALTGTAYYAAGSLAENASAAYFTGSDPTHGMGP